MDTCSPKTFITHLAFTCLIEREDFNFYLHFGQPALEEEVGERDAVVPRIVDVIVARVCKEAELQSHENDFYHLNDKFVGKPAMRK